jgi:hypothetical protein
VPLHSLTDYGSPPAGGCGGPVPLVRAVLVVSRGGLRALSARCRLARGSSVLGGRACFGDLGPDLGGSGGRRVPAASLMAWRGRFPAPFRVVRSILARFGGGGGGVASGWVYLRELEGPRV